MTLDEIDALMIEIMRQLDGVSTVEERQRLDDDFCELKRRRRRLVSMWRARKRRTRRRP